MRDVRIELTRCPVPKTGGPPLAHFPIIGALNEIRTRNVWMEARNVAITPSKQILEPKSRIELEFNDYKSIVLPLNYFGAFNVLPFPQQTEDDLFGGSYLQRFSLLSDISR